jgi:signal transduction histidine kinase
VVLHTLKKGRISNTNIVILASVVAVVLGISIFSYQYSTFTSQKIADIALQEVRSTTRIEAHDVSQILTNKLEGIGALLRTLADAPAIHNNEYERANIVINNRQNSSSDITDFYMWLDKDGKINWISNINESAYQKYKGTDLSYRPYFIIPNETRAVYYSSLIESNDKIPRLYISYPVINMSNTGKDKGILTGVVIASMRLDNLGNFLKNQLFPQFNSTIGLLDKNGTILYLSGAQQYAGEYVFGEKFQSVLSSSLRTSESKNLLNSLIRNSLEGNTGFEDILINGKTNTIAFEPVVVNDKDFLILYIGAQHTLAGDVGALIDQQQYFTILIMSVIGAIAFIIVLLVFSWNKRLEKMVNARTGELKKANDALEESNEHLALANEQLKINDRMQNEFINIASHEMKTPTQAILGYSKLIQRHPEKRDEMIQAISRNATRLQRLSSDILDVTRIESGTLWLNLERFNLNEVILDVVEDYRSELERSGNYDVRLIFEDQNKILQIEGDKNRLTQVISNLVGNALKFTTHGSITVKTEIEEEVSKALVSVKDTGSGIDHEIMPRLFTKFVAKSNTGTGLGLFISKKIIEAHGGRIWASNNNSLDGNSNSNRGAFFAFSIPLNKPEEEK